MREKKFRAWDGYKMYLPENCDEEDFFITCDGDIKYTSEVGFEGHIILRHRKDWTLMQFTGLTDRNGQEIYERDIVEYQTTEGTLHCAEITWDNELCCLMVGIMPYPQLYQSAFIQPSKIDFLLLGNSFKNWDLL